VTPAVCCYPKKLEATDAGCSGPKPPLHWSHETKRQLTRIVPPISELYHPIVHANCVCNEVVAVTNRVLGEVPKPSAEGLRSLRTAARIILRKLHPVSPWTAEQVLTHFKGRRRARYQNAWDSLRDEPLTIRDGLIKAFIKPEKMNVGAKINPDPRVIQARNARYNILLAQYLKPMEEQLYNIKGGWSRTRLIAKGLNQADRARLFLRKWAGFSQPVCYSLDASRWDKHCDVELIRLEHSVYERLCPDHYLTQLLRMQIHNRCVTSGGVRYKTLGKRMSGDMNTALGNCLLMIICLESACHTLGLRKYDILDDGDDCLVIVERGEEAKLAGIIHQFLAYGHELKLENRATDLHAVQFCQSKIVLRQGLAPTFVRDWVKVLSGACVGTRYWHEPTLRRPMLRAVGDCEMALNQGVPIIQAFASRLRALGSSTKRLKLEAEEGIVQRAAKELHVGVERALAVAADLKEAPIGYEARETFWRAFGVDPLRQLEIEKAIGEWQPELARPAEPVDVEIDYRWQHRLDARLLGRETY